MKSQRTAFRLVLCAVALCAVVLCSMATTSARADMVGSDPRTDCASFAVSAPPMHGPEYCAPRRCRSSGDCLGDQTCQMVAACTSEQTSGGLDEGPNAPTHTEVLGRCGEGLACDATCEQIRVCEGPVPSDLDLTFAQWQDGRYMAETLALVAVVVGLSIVVYRRRRRAGPNQTTP